MSMNLLLLLNYHKKRESLVKTWEIGFANPARYRVEVARNNRRGRGRRIRP